MERRRRRIGIVTSAIDGGRESGAATPVRSKRPVLIFIAVLIGIVLTFYGIRIATDAPFLVTGTEPEPEDFEARYVAHPWLAYLHMTPGVLYLLGAPLQLSERFRTKHYTAHRRLGRVLVTCRAAQRFARFDLRPPLSHGAELSRPWPRLFSAAGSWSACCSPFEPFGAGRCPSIGVG